MQNQFVPVSVGLSAIYLGFISEYCLMISGQYFANEIPAVAVHQTGSVTIFEMEKILWIRPEDIESGIVRIVEK